MVRKPSLLPFSTMSQSKVPWASGASSSSSVIGLICSSANFCAVICQLRCSLLREKSMVRPLFRGEHRLGSTVADQRLGDAQLVVGVAVAGVQADQCVV